MPADDTLSILFPDPAEPKPRRIRAAALARWAVGLVVVVAGVAACGGDDSMDPDPGAPGNDDTEIDGGETDPGMDTTSTSFDETGGGQGGGGATEGNQVVPGEMDTTPSTAQDVP